MPRYQKISDKIEKVTINNPNNNNKPIIWTNIKNPRSKEIEYLKKQKKGFKKEHLETAHAKHFSQRPKIDTGNKYLFLTLLFPVFKNGKVAAEEINFFIGHGFLFTLHRDKISCLNELFQECQKKQKYLLSYKLESSAILLYEILQELINYSYSLIDRIGADIDQVEESIFSWNQKKAAVQILNIRRNVINMRKIMQNHKNILRRLMTMESSVVSMADIKKYYQNLVDHSKRIWEFSENQKETVEALHDTNQTLQNNHMNRIMKTLTIFTGTIFPLNLIAGLLSMNIKGGMPLLNVDYGFWIIVAFMVVLDLSAWLILKKKGWV